jgi:hypothetical protein
MRFARGVSLDWPRWSRSTTAYHGLYQKSQQISSTTSKLNMATVTDRGDSSEDGGNANSSKVALPHNSYQPSAAGSVIEAMDGFGGTVLIRIQNIASTANFGVRLDLKKIALKCRNTEFNPRRFGAVIMRLREPRATALIFSR